MTSHAMQMGSGDKLPAVQVCNILSAFQFQLCICGTWVHTLSNAYKYALELECESKRPFVPVGVTVTYQISLLLHKYVKVQTANWAQTHDCISTYKCYCKLGTRCVSVLVGTGKKSLPYKYALWTQPSHYTCRNKCKCELGKGSILYKCMLVYMGIGHFLPCLSTGLNLPAEQLCISESVT